ncbi:MAG TPA: tetratricopeptide repeat protein [Steroidobacteraceae bacterium]|nr:tetratricopeptide repeat protein [Steroidobacteraceae bacterium]
MRQARRKMPAGFPPVNSPHPEISCPMPRRIAPLFLWSCLMFAGPAAAAAQTFGLDGGQAALAARPHAEWVRQAQALEKRADWTGLLAWGRAWAQADANNPLAWFIQGRALGEMGRHAEAIAAYRQNLRLAPGDVWAHNNLGNAYRDSGRPREAMQAYRAAVEADPDYVPAWYNLGLTFYLTKGEAGATQALRKLQAADPELAAVWRALAVEYSVTHDPQIAREAVRVLRDLSETRRARLFGILFAEG